MPIWRSCGCLGVVLLAGGCLGGSTSPAPPSSGDGSTLQATWHDPAGIGELQPGPGEPLVDRTELAPRGKPGATLATLVQIADAHVTDEESPARVEMLDRLGGRYSSAFRPQESLTTQVLAGIVKAADAVHPDAVIESGDLIDNAQANELGWATTILNGGTATPDSGAPGYTGVQAASNPDPLYYRPAVDPPSHPGLLAEAQRPVRSPGLDAPWYPLPGNHDLLVQGNLAADPATQAVAVGSRKLIELSPTVAELARQGRLTPQLIDSLLAHGLPGRTVPVPPDPRRRLLSPQEAIAELRSASHHGGSGPLMDEVVDAGPDVRLLLLDTAPRDLGAAGIVRPEQVDWVREQLAAAGGRWVIVFSSTPLTETNGADPVLSLLDADPHMVAAAAGDVHHNSIEARHTEAGGYWLITTSSLADYPQQARVLRLRRAGSGVVLETWMLNATGEPLADTSRQLAFLDYQGGRPRHLAGRPADRNARLWR